MIGQARPFRSVTSSPLRLLSIWLMAMLALGLWGYQPASAQRLADGLSGFTQRSNEPIEIEADALEVLDSENVAVFTGNVRVTQGTAELETRELRVHYVGGADQNNIGPASSQGLRLLEAIGAVRIRSEQEYAEGDQGRFDFVTETITLTGNVLLQQGENLLRGQRLVVDLASRESRLEAAPSAGAGSQRVTGVFVPGSDR
ncbi:MAG: LptA/OstA family protein [Pseudomonadota bacterium]